MEFFYYFSIIIVCIMALIILSSWVVHISDILLNICCYSIAVISIFLISFPWYIEIFLFIIVLMAAFIMVHVGPAAKFEPREKMNQGEAFARIGDFNVHYRVMGSGEKTLVFLHAGPPIGMTTWEKVQDELAKNYKLLMLDLPAGGLTKFVGLNEKRRTAFTLINQAELVNSLMDKLNISNGYLVGNSAGGTLSMYMAVNYPQKVNGLVLISPGADKGIGKGTSNFTRLNFSHLAGIKSGLLGMRMYIGYPKAILKKMYWYSADALNKSYDIRKFEIFCNENWDQDIMDWMRYAVDLKLKNKVSTIKVPTLVVAPQNDKFISVEYNKMQTKGIQNVCVEIIKESGHLPQEENPEEFIRVVKDFLER